MSRYVRNTVIQAQIEAAYGTDPGSWSGTFNVPVMRATFDDQKDRVPRELMRGHMGAFEELYATGMGRISFEVELASSGTAGTAPAYGPLLRACGFAQTITAGNRVEYQPVSSAFESITLRYFIDGVLYTASGARGTVAFRLNAFGLPVMAFDFTSLAPVATAAAADTGDFTAWKKPLVINEANAGAWRIGPTYSAGAISGGTLAVTGDFEVNIGNTVQHQKLLNGRAIEITDRRTTGRGTLFFSAAADEVAWYAATNADATTSLGFVLGSAAGAKIGLHMPAVQRLQARPQDYQGRAVIAADFSVAPSAGNDEVRLVIS